MKQPLREKLKSMPLPEGELSPEEQALLEKMLDQQLASQWATKLAEHGVEKVEKKTPVVRLRPWHWAAAACVVLGVVGWFLWGQLSKPSYERMAQQQLSKPFDLDENLFRGENEVDELRSKSFAEYHKGNYEAALNSISPLLNDGPAKQGDFFLAGLCKLYQHEPDYPSAANFFLRERQLFPNSLTDEVNWYLGLSYLLDDKIAQAKEALQKVAASPSSRQAMAAKKILGELD